MAILRIRNWERYQHYKDRNPLWVKLYATDLMMSADWIQWDDASRVLAIASIALACRYQGSDGNGRGNFEVPTLEYVKASCNLNQLPDFKPLVDSRFLFVIEDASNVLAGCYQDASNLLDRVEKSREEESSASRGPDARKNALPFEDFWELYPLKKSKKKAQVSWERLTIKNQQAAMAALPEHVIGWNDPRYIPLPTTWLNQERWNDELELSGGDYFQKELRKMEEAELGRTKP